MPLIPAVSAVGLEFRHPAKGGRGAILRPADVQAACGELHLLPLQIAQLRSPKSMSVADQDHGRIPMAPAAAVPGRRHQAVNWDLIPKVAIGRSDIWTNNPTF